MDITNDKIDIIVDILKITASRYPRAYANAHRDENTHPEHLDFIILATRDMWNDPRLIGPKGERAGMNGKRGDRENPSSDAIAYGRDRDVIISDILIGAGEHNGNINRITWQDVTAISQPLGGILLNPFEWPTHVNYGSSNPPEKEPPEKEPPQVIERIVYVNKQLPNPGELMEELHYLHDFYKDELKREDGLWIDGKPDFEGISAWILGVYIPQRMIGKTKEESRETYVKMIRASHEWKERNQ